MMLKYSSSSSTTITTLCIHSKASTEIARCCISLQHFVMRKPSDISLLKVYSNIDLITVMFLLPTHELFKLKAIFNRNGQDFVRNVC